MTTDTSTACRVCGSGAGYEPTHTLFNIFASIRLRGGWKGRVASLSLSAVGEKLAC
ncbi:MAG: hypothetical protein ABW250_14595 [Pyrinomonadaceae bacterium]